MKSDNVRFITNNNVKYIEYPIFDNYDYIKCVASTRIGGVSQGKDNSSMNLGYKTIDEKENIDKNFKIFASAVGILAEDMVASSQYHNANIRVCNDDDRGKGVTRERDYEDIDGLITNEKNVALTIFSADCVPVLFLDTKNKAIGAAHCGWKGTFKGLQKKMTDKMSEIYSTSPSDILVVIGASIKKCCYQVSKELYDDFIKRFPFIEATPCAEIKDGEYYLDLPLINKEILMHHNIKEENIFVCDLCTSCNSHELFSHRAQGPGRGIMVNVIQLI